MPPFFTPKRSSDLVSLDDGLTFEDIAEYLSISRSTVVRDFRMAQAWLKNYVTA